MQDRNFKAILNHNIHELNVSISNVNQRNAEGLTLIQLAAREGFLRGVLELIINDADINQINYINHPNIDVVTEALKTPLYLAIENHHDNVARLLLLCHCDAEKTKFFGSTINPSVINKLTELQQLPSERFLENLLFSCIDRFNSFYVMEILRKFLLPDSKINFGALYELALAKHALHAADYLMGIKKEKLYPSPYGAYWTLVKNEKNKNELDYLCKNDDDWLTLLKQLHDGGRTEHFAKLYRNLEPSLQNRFFEEEKQQSNPTLMPKQQFIYKQLSLHKEMFEDLFNQTPDELYSIIEYAYEKNNYLVISEILRRDNTKELLKLCLQNKNESLYNLIEMELLLKPGELATILGNDPALIASLPDKISIAHQLISRGMRLKNTFSKNILQFIKHCQLSNSELFSIIKLNLRNHFNINIKNSYELPNQPQLTLVITQELSHRERYLVQNRCKQFQIVVNHHMPITKNNFSLIPADIWRSNILSFFSMEELDNVSILSHEFYDYVVNMTMNAKQKNLYLLKQEVTLLALFIENAANSTLTIESAREATFNRKIKKISIFPALVLLMSVIGLIITALRRNHIYHEMENIPVITAFEEEKTCANLGEDFLHGIPELIERCRKSLKEIEVCTALCN